MKTKKAEPVTPSTSIENCHFTGVHWDAKAIESVQTVAMALLNLTELFKAQGVTMEAMIKIDSGEIKTP